jgi:hypothetical protein
MLRWLQLHTTCKEGPPLPTTNLKKAMLCAALVLLILNAIVRFEIMILGQVIAKLDAIMGPFVHDLIMWI